MTKDLFSAAEVLSTLTWKHKTYTFNTLLVWTMHKKHIISQCRRREIVKQKSAAVDLVIIIIILEKFPLSSTKTHIHWTLCSFSVLHPHLHFGLITERAQDRKMRWWWCDFRVRSFYFAPFALPIVHFNKSLSGHQQKSQQAKAFTGQANSKKVNKI